jgi:hypothetical protein
MLYLVQCAEKHAEEHKSTQKHKESRGSKEVFKYLNWTTFQMLKMTFSIFWLAVQKSVAHFEGWGRVCVCRSHSMDSFLLSKRPIPWYRRGIKKA